MWRDRLPSRALGQLEIHILGAACTEEDVPGWLIPQIYFDTSAAAMPACSRASFITTLWM
ncbi:MAG: hypothetical protein U0401_04855 [Anaerolineae bacterium]